MTDNIIKFPEVKFSDVKYVLDCNKEPCGIQIEKGDISIELDLDGCVELHNCFNIELTSEELKLAMIMWLSLIDPEVINYDAESLK